MTTEVLPQTAQPQARPQGFKLWEKGLIALACLLFAVSCYLYVSDFPLRGFIFGIEDDIGRQSVGKLELKAGALRRQLDGESEFKTLNPPDEVYNDDVIVTGPDSSATVRLADGSTLELAPDTMVRLHFQTQLSLGGISRAAVVDVVAGTVKARNSKGQEAAPKLVRTKPARPAPLPRIAFAPAKAVPAPLPVVTPSPTPSPIPPPVVIAGVKLVSPIAGTRFSLPPNSTHLELPVQFNWTVRPVARPVRVTLYKLASAAPGAARSVVYQQVVADQDGQGRAASVLKQAGLYEWDLRTPKGEPIAGGRGTSARFTLDPEFDAIETIDPLIGGKPMSSSRLSGALLDNFDITLRWKPYLNSKQYIVLVKAKPDPKSPALQRRVNAPSFLFSRGKVYNGEFFYQIKVPLNNGFVARSPLKPFSFTFLAPIPIVPKDHTVVTAQNLEEESDSVLMTWQKTNFTDWYEIELSNDPAFKAVLKRVRQKENFYIFKSPAAATYFWRVRSSSKSLVSSFSQAFELTVQR
jgi:hypothetical protein